MRTEDGREAWEPSAGSPTPHNAVSIISALPSLPPTWEFQGQVHSRCCSCCVLCSPVPEGGEPAGETEALRVTQQSRGRAWNSAHGWHRAMHCVCISTALHGSYWKPSFTGEKSVLGEIKPFTHMGGRSGIRVGTLHCPSPPSSLEPHVRRRKRGGASLSSASPASTGNPSLAIIGSETRGQGWR